MSARAHSPISPRYTVRADDKHSTRIDVIADLLSHLDYAGKDKKKDNMVVLPNPNQIFTYEENYLCNGSIASRACGVISYSVREAGMRGAS